MRMTRTEVETIAETVLIRNGIAAVWKLEEAAAEAHQMGKDTVAVTIMEIADAAERQLRLASFPNGASSPSAGIAAPGEQIAVEVFSWVVLFAFIAALFAEVYG